MRYIVTGTSSGIGHTLTLDLLTAGHEVWGLARRPQSELTSRFPTTFRAAPVDVSDWPALATLATTIAGTWPQVHGLILCAGIQGEIGPALTADPVRWSETVRLNLDGTFFPIRAFASLLTPAPGPRAKIMAFSGGGATKARPNFSAYAAAKTAIVRLVENLAAEWTDQPIDINAIAPGAIPTRLTDEVIALGPTLAGQAEYDSAVKLKAEGNNALERTRALVTWLLSPASDRITGRLLAAVWDPWPTLGDHAAALAPTDVFTLRRILPEERQLPLT